MNKRRVLIAVSAVAMGLGTVTPTLLAGAEGPGLGPTTTTSLAAAAATTTVAGEFVLPPGFTYVVDDTNRITVAVPAAWTDIVLTPATVDGAVVPSINAATNLDVWESSFAAPGVQYAAFPFTADPQTLIDRFGITSGCAANTVVPYADGLFTGSWAQWTECGGTSGQAQSHLIVASPPDQAFTALVIVQLVGPQDQQALDVVLETFNVTPSATWPASGAPPSSTAPSSTAPAPTVPASTVVATTVAPATVATTAVPVPTPPVTAASSTTLPGSTLPAPTTTGPAGLGVRLVDETNFLTVTVPADWTDQNLANSRHDDGSERATITAAPDIQQYYESWDSPGTHLLALPATTQPAALLSRFSYPNTCTDGGITPFDDGRLTGQRQTWLNCDGLATRVVNVAARPLDGSFTMFIQVQQTTPDDAVLDQIIASAGPVAGAIYPAPIVAAPLAPVGPVPPELLVAPTIPLSNVTDEQGRLSVSVPAAWSDSDVRVLMNDDASDRPRVAAAADLDSFYSNWLFPGVQVVGYPFTSDPSTLLRNLGFADQCLDGGVQTFSNGTFTGLMQTWSSCGDTVSRNVLLAISPADQSMTVYVEVQLPDQDNTALQAVLSSLRVG